MNIEKHAEAQKQIREMEWATHSAKHRRMRALRKAYFEEKEADRIEEQTFSEALNEYLETLSNRRETVAKQKFTCTCCGSPQIQLVSWMSKVVDLRCRKCKHKFIWESPI